MLDLAQLRDEIEPFALRLLLKETPEEQKRLLWEAQDEMFLAWGIDAHMHPERGPHQGVSDLVNAPGLASVASSQGVTLEHVLGAEDFRDLLDRLIPANPDR